MDLVKRLACLSCEVTLLDMHQPEVAARANSLGIERVPAVIVDGKLADCCSVAVRRRQASVLLEWALLCRPASP